MIDGITPQQRMIKEIEDYEVNFSAPSLLINQERVKFVCRRGRRVTRAKRDSSGEQRGRRREEITRAKKRRGEKSIN